MKSVSLHCLLGQHQKNQADQVHLVQQRIVLHRIHLGSQLFALMNMYTMIQCYSHIRLHVFHFVTVHVHVRLGTWTYKQQPKVHGFRSQNPLNEFEIEGTVYIYSFFIINLTIV